MVCPPATAVCKDAFAPIIESGAPVVVLKDWSQLPEVLATLAADPAGIAQRQQRLQEWYRAFIRSVTLRIEREIYDAARAELQARSESNTTHTGRDVDTDRARDHDRRQNAVAALGACLRPWIRHDKRSSLFESIETNLADAKKSLRLLTNRTGML